MTLALLYPAGLAALAALLVPLLLHLARRSEQRITDFAALRWLAANPRPRRKRRFDEHLLLLLRLLLLAALALLLAQPVLHGAPDRTPWVVAAPGVPAATVHALAGRQRAQLHWLAPGFPALDAPSPPAGQPVASLLRELDARLPEGTPLTVLVPTVFDGADAERPRLSRPVAWQVLPTTTPAASRAARPAPPSLEVRAGDDAPGWRYLRAAGAAWAVQRGAASTPSVHVGDPSQPLPPRSHALAWLAPGPLPDRIRAWVRDGGRALLAETTQAPELATMSTVAWRDTQGAPLVVATALGHGRLMRFTRPLAPSAMPELLEADFPRHLRALFDDAPVAPARVAAADYAPTTGAHREPQAPRPLAPWLLGAIAVLFSIERWLAGAARREAAP